MKLVAWAQETRNYLLLATAAAFAAGYADLVRGGISRDDFAKTIEMEYGWRATGCPLTPPTGGCLQYQQLDALMAEIRASR